MNVIETFVIQKVFLLVFTIFIFMQNKRQNETGKINCYYLFE